MSFASSALSKFSYEKLFNVAHQYLMDSHATCVLWHSSFDIQLRTTEPLALLILEHKKWFIPGQDNDFYNYEPKRFDFEEHNLPYNDWILRVAVAIEQTHCEVSFSKPIQAWNCWLRMAIGSTQRASSAKPIQFQQLRIYSFN